MSERDCDIAIVGGGLAGGLIALALATKRPEVSVRLIEAGPTVGGNHRFGWFGTDISREGKVLMKRFNLSRWNEGYDVAFPDYRHHVRTRYRSLSSENFAAELAAMLPAGTILTNSPVASLDAAGVTLASGRRIAAGAVIDCREFAPSGNLTGGWQVFLGRYLRTSRPHRVKRPVIMDATVGQSRSFRFVYVLPLGECELFLEDTYYQDSSELDHDAAMRRLDRYAGRRGWNGEMSGDEAGVLPVIAGGDFEAWQDERRIDGVARAGPHAGFLHPLTGYSVPFAVETAVAVARAKDLSGPALAALLDERARAHWKATRYYRRVATVLFGGARASKRWKVFERFFHLPSARIERFFAARATPIDRLRILCGRPPVPLLRTLRALTTQRAPLLEDE
jgi:lycopene beta-cyclase